MMHHSTKVMEYRILSLHIFWIWYPPTRVNIEMDNKVANDH